MVNLVCRLFLVELIDLNFIEFIWVQFNLLEVSGFQSNSVEFSLKWSGITLNYFLSNKFQ